MDYSEYSEPPNKRRRFFANPAADDNPPNDGHAATDPPPIPSGQKPRFFQDVDNKSFRVDTASTPPSNSSPSVRLSPPSGREIDDAFHRPTAAQESPGTSSNASVGCLAFDQDTFESFVGAKVRPEVLGIIRESCGNNIEKAVNMYLDGTWKNFRKKPTVARLASPTQPLSRATERRDLPKDSLVAPATHMNMPKSRYIGAFGVEGWATRSGTGLLKHGDPVRIERQKIQPPQPSSSKGKGGNQVNPPRPNTAAAKRVDVIVRFTSTSGAEIGRLAKDAANWVSTLIDQKICRFEGTCVYSPERLRTNDTVFLQLTCTLLRTAFTGRSFQLVDNRATGIYEQSETSEERDLRLRQVALVRLFQEINLVPIRSNAAAAKHQRQGLLEAAEMAEKKEKDASRVLDRDDPGLSPPSDEAEDGEELEQDQLDALYRKAQSFDLSTPEAEPADTFAMTLRPYQKQSLYWMMAKERDERDTDREVSMHPLWEEYAWPTKDFDDKEVASVSSQPSFYVNPYSGDLSLDFPLQEQHCLGGILADEMGLGKTIQMLSLIHTHKSEIAIASRKAGTSLGSVNSLPRLPSGSPAVLSAPCTTLVVAPMSLLAQWQSEAENASQEGTLRSIVYYGNEKTGDLQSLCCEANAASAPDLVITSYGIVLSEFTQRASREGGGRSSSHRGLFSLNFFRVILDEAHSIKNRQSKTARACYEIAAEHRWVLTGTPIVNRLEDLFSLVRFLRVEPWNNFSFWRTFITLPFESKNFVRALDVVQTVLEPLVMRRTKDMKTADGQPLVALPAKEIEVVDIELSQAERDVYDYIFTRAKRTFFANVEAGTVLKAFTSIFTQILRLRQSCCHPVLVRHRGIVAEEEVAGAAADAAAGLADDMDLHSLIERFTATTDDDADANAFGAHVLQQIRDEAVNECPICTEEPMVDQTVTGCWHSACKKCLLDYIKHESDRDAIPRCFHCREKIDSRGLFEVVRHDDEPSAFGAHPRISLQRLGVNMSSAKIVALIDHLRALRKEHPHMKSVVFSQFTSFLSLIEPALSRARINFLRLDGSLAQKARTAVLSEFRESASFTVLLISLKAGGVGLNLTAAKRVFMMDPWWSFAVEAQAIDRVHRMGQEDEVRVYRFIVRGSVEERMLKVQERKKFLATSLGMMTDEEQKLQRIEDIRELLS